jgi:hypothetical protein
VQAYDVGVMIRLAAISLGALLLACAPQTNAPPAKDASPPAAAKPAPKDETPAPTPDADAMFACKSDDECVVLEMGCCDHCNGGWRLSVNKAHTDAATAKHHDTGCTGACTERGCDWDTAPACNEGACAYTEDRSGSGKRELFSNELK